MRAVPIVAEVAVADSPESAAATTSTPGGKADTDNTHGLPARTLALAGTLGTHTVIAADFAVDPIFAFRVTVFFPALVKDVVNRE